MKVIGGNVFRAPWVKSKPQHVKLSLKKPNKVILFTEIWEETTFIKQLAKGTRCDKQVVNL
jgi:hypothetical protein